MNRLLFPGLRSRLFLLVLLAILPLAGLVIYVDIEQRGQSKAQLAHEADRLMRLSAVTQERFLEDARRLLIVVSQSAEVRAGGEPCAAFLARLLPHYPAYRNIGVARADGDLICSGLPSTVGPVNLAHRAYFRRAVEHRDFAAGEYQVGRTGIATVNFGHPLLDDDGRILGVVFVALDLEWLNRLGAQAHLPPGAVLAVMDRNGTILERFPESQTWVGRSFPEAPLFALMRSRGEGVADVAGLDGKPRMYAFRRLGDRAGANLYVAVGLPTEPRLAEARQSLLRNLAIVAMVGLIGLALASFAGDLFVLRPVRRLVETSRRLSAGNLAARSGLVYGHDEVSELARAFDEMAQSLQDRDAQLREAERHVAEAKLAGERKQTEEARLRLAAIVESSDDAIFSKTLDGVITSWNDGAERIYGYSAAEIIGQPVSILVPPEDADEVPRILEQIKDGEHTRQHQTVRLRKDGTRIHVSLTVSPIHAAEGTIVGASAIARDITEQKRAETALRESEEKLQAILDNSTALVYLKDLEGRFRLVNRRFEQVCNVTRQQALGKTDYDLFSKEVADAFRANDQKVLDTGGPAEFEEIASLPDGSHTYISSKFPLRDADGVTYGICGISTDITDRKRAELIVDEARREAERANRAKDEFLSRMSHELRTPLNAILGFAQVLEIEGLAPEHQDCGQQIIKGGRHLLSLINEVLDIARIESGRLALSLEAVNVSELLQEVLSLVEPLAADRQLDVQAAASEDMLRYVLADRQRLRQVLLNLMSNAVKYNHKGGRVTLSCQVRGDRLAICVADTGGGLSSDKVERLFTAFDRLGAEETGIEGTGLGLALSKGLIEMMGGTIGVESTPGRGSSFRVELPLTESPVERMEQADAESVPTVVRIDAAKTVLYIEDNVPNLKLIQRVLVHRPGIELLSAKTGRMGLELAAQRHPDAIFLDLHLPDIHGYEVLQQLRASPATEGIPVVVVSADATAGQVKRLLSAGAREYLSKPLDVQRFLELLDDTLELKPPAADVETHAPGASATERAA